MIINFQSILLFYMHHTFVVSTTAAVAVAVATALGSGNKDSVLFILFSLLLNEKVYF